MVVNLLLEGLLDGGSIPSQATNCTFQDIPGRTKSPVNPGFFFA
jgi:hypothetical protein